MKSTVIFLKGKSPNAKSLHLSIFGELEVDSGFTGINKRCR
jgi:hypothetical protein